MAIIQTPTTIQKKRNKTMKFVIVELDFVTKRMSGPTEGEICACANHEIKGAR
jgi:hypothetical protein